ncbi:MAG: FAD-binding protein, partial [Shewanella sp.]
RVANMEFNQFHPTCLYHADARNFLLTEALRGEGAYLRRPDGSRFMPEFDDRAELAPRDIVARAIDYEMKRLGADCVYLDISHKDSDFIIKHFPTIYRRCLELGIDITKDPIPVVPAAHYTCGGVMTDLHGQTDLNGLYAIGEVAYTGLHGANRLASNSLLECLVFARAAALDIESQLQKINPPGPSPPWDESQVSNSDEEVVIAHNWHELRLFMWDYVGIVRSDKRLERALRRCLLLQQEIQEYYRHFRVSNNLLELRNLVQVAELIIRCAMERKESRGLHYNIDHPEKLAAPRPTILQPEIT